MNAKWMMAVALAAGTAVSAGARTVKVSDFGYDAEDSTRFLQAVFDSGAERVIVDRQAGPWYTLPLKGRSNQEVVFEDGVELVAKKGAFLGLRDYLLYHENTTNVVIRGLGEKGGTLRMHKKDYQKPPYKPGEWRYALRLEGVVNALVENMSFVSSGGDGIVVCGRKQPPRNVTIRKCVCDDNHRQGISVTQADGLLIEDTVLKNTDGTPPQAGIDFEPDHNREMLRNCVMRRCVSENNKGSGYEFYFNAMDDGYVPVSIRIEDCTAIGNGNSVSVGGAGSRIDHVVRGSLAFTNCVFREASTAGINVFGKPADAFSLTFDDCTVERAKAGWLGADVVFWNQRYGQQYDDGIAFNNLKVVQTGKPHPWFAYKKASIGRKPVGNVTGIATVTDTEGKVRTYELDSVWRLDNMPKANPTPIPPRVELKGLGNPEILDAHPGEMTEYGQLASFQAVKYAFAVDRPRTVRFRIRQAERDGKRPTSASAPLRFAHVATGAKSTLPMPGFEPTVVEFEAKKAGLYELTASAYQSYFIIEAADVPLALDAHENPRMVMSPSLGPFSVWFAVPGGRDFAFVTCGSDASASYAADLFDPSGKRRDSRGRVYAWTSLPVAAEDAAAGLWRLDGREAKGYQYWLMQLDLRGVPGYFFLSPERTWRFDARRMDGVPAKVSVDFGAKTGPVKPVNGIGQGPARGDRFNLFSYLKEARIPFARLHDVGGAYGGNRFVDIPNVFRDFDADENDPKNYDFTFTDKYLAALVENGVEPYYRLGVTIENFCTWKAYRIFPPKDYAKWARICEHVIRHYTEGWADGYRWKIRYWEIWNEPENLEDPMANQMWRGSFAEYCRFYGVVSKYLKGKFPGLKIGGYASCGFYAVTRKDPSPRFQYLYRCFPEFMDYVKANECPLDFFSFHFYDQPENFAKQMEFVRRTLDEAGYRDTETHCNEWLPASEPGSANQMAKIAACLVEMQNSSLDKSMVYDGRCGIGNYSPLFDPSTLGPRPAYWVYRGFRALRELGTSVKAACAEPGVYVTAATDGDAGEVMVVNLTGRRVPLALDFKGLGPVSARLVSATSSYAVKSLADIATLDADSCAFIRCGRSR